MVDGGRWTIRVESRGERVVGESRERECVCVGGGGGGGCRKREVTKKVVVVMIPKGWGLFLSANTVIQRDAEKKKERVCMREKERRGREEEDKESK